MNDKKIKELEKRIADLQKEVDLLRKVNELEQEIKKFKEASPTVIPHVPYVPYLPYPAYPELVKSPWLPWTITWHDGNTSSISTDTYKINGNDVQISLTNSGQAD